MSIVERALAKLQASRRTLARVAPRVPQPGPPVGQVVEHGPGATAVEPAIRDGKRREYVGNPAKRLRLDYDALRLVGLLPPEHQERELANQYRNLKRPLILHAFHDANATAKAGRASQRLIMVTSALPDEGKTFTSINLALSLAMEHDHSVLLVDGDVPKPHVSRTFGIENQPGLLDLVGNPALAVESAVLSTSVPGLSILPAGTQTETATEVLSSQRMREVIMQLETLDPQGLVIVDSPPVLLTSEARVLASLFGQVVMIVKAGSTPQQAVTEALHIIGDIPRIGLVLNQAAHEELGGRYGYGYGYGYGGGEHKAGARGGTSDVVPAARGAKR